VLVFFDVGQGDSALVTCNGVDVLIDSGPGDILTYKIGKYLNHMDRDIDYVILTHPHSDHIDGMYELVRRYNIQTLLISPVCSDLAVYKQIFNFVKNDRIKLVNSVKVVVSERNFKVEFEEEMQDPWCGNVNLNNYSVITDIIFFKVKVLLMGDAEVEQERKLIDRDLLNDIDILKAGHHCSNTSSSKDFLEYVTPDIAICSVGKDNSFGHPGDNTINLFKSMKIRYLMTMEVGDIIINRNGDIIFNID